VPTANTGASSPGGPVPARAPNYITEQEILAVVEPGGTTTGALALRFKSRLTDLAVRNDFVVKLKRTTVYREKLLYKREGL